MTRLFNYFALVVMGALICSCAEEVEDAQPSVGGTVTMKTTVSLSENASTRALTEAGVKTFTAGDQIAVLTGDTSCQDSQCGHSGDESDCDVFTL